LAALSHDQLIDIAVDGYFGSVARRDVDRLVSLLAPTCVMHVVSADIVYDGKPAIVEHFDDFLSTYHRITITDFDATADVARQKVAVRFAITLYGDGNPIRMTNCNFFTIDDSGRFSHVAIHMSDLPEKGF